MGDDGMNRTVRAAWILAIGIVLASIILGGSFHKARSARSTVQVVGMASQPFEADMVKWSLSVSRTVPVRGSAAAVLAQEYFYSGLAAVKRSLLARATEDARMRAEEIASATNESIGGIVSAHAGVFQITEPYSTETAAYGVYNTSSREKQIRVTLHAVFRLD